MMRRLFAALLWVRSASKVKGVVGIMSTTWANNYADLEEVAQVARN